jgi:hypothetical protein
MIENDLQLRVSKTKLAEFKTTLQELEQDDLALSAKTMRRRITESIDSSQGCKGVHAS